MQREDFLSLDKFRCEPIEVKDKTFYVREMEACDFDVYEQAALKAYESKSMAGIRSLLVALCLCDDRGNKLFSQSDTAAIDKLPKSVVTKVAEAAKKLNSLSVEDQEDLEKN